MPLRLPGRTRFRNSLPYKAAVPIVNDRSEIVGWTEKAPVVHGTMLCHEDAERLVGPLAVLYVQIDNHGAAVRAGAPPDWNGPWRCLALCSDRIRPDALHRISFLPKSAVVVKVDRMQPIGA
jgi:hypothetical protein